MSVKTVHFEQLKLSYAAEDLKLSVTSFVDLKLPNNRLASLDGEDLLEALTTENIWISRGSACRLEFQLSYNGKPLEIPSRMRTLENLGYHLRDAYLWSQLSLSTALVIPQQNIKNPQTDFFLYLNNATFSTSPKSMPRGWLLDNVDVKPPNAVLCAEFERLQLKLDIRKVQKKTSKRLKSGQGEFEDLMLFDLHESEEHLEPLAEDDKSSQTLPVTAKTLPNHVTVDFNASSVQVPSKSGKRFSKRVTDILVAWLEAHASNPFPTKEEKENLLKQTGLKSSQLTSWLVNNRKRCLDSTTNLGNNDSHDMLLFPDDDISMNLPLLQDNTEPDDEMLFFEGEDHPNTCPFDENILLLQMEHEEPSMKNQVVTQESENYDLPIGYTLDGEGDILFPQLIDNRTALVSRSSAHSTNTLASSVSTLKRSIDTDNADISLALPILNSASVCKLVDAAFRILLNGSSGRGQEKLSGIVAKKPPPARTLSSLVPAVFSPGFKELMAHNAKFLPTVSNVICSSWVRNVQSPDLRDKLLELSNKYISDLADHDDNLAIGSIERLTAVVYGRMWSMMQRTLYDPGASKKLRWKISNTENEGEEAGEEDDDANLLQEIRSTAPMHRQDNDNLFVEEFMDEEEELFFSDLWKRENLEQDGDGLLDYFEEIERRAVEMETDEMLLGDVSDGDVGYEEDTLLLEESIDRTNTMLL